MSDSVVRSVLRPGFPFRAFLFAVVVAFVSLHCLVCSAQSTVSRVGQIDAGQRVLQGSKHPLASAQYLVGHAASTTRLRGVTLYFKPSASQQAALTALLAEQQNPASPNYHKWLTPAQYRAQFGLSAADINAVAEWLGEQGLTVNSTSPTHITFSGDVAHIEAALRTQINNYKVNGVEHMANATDLTLPSAIAGVTAGIENLSQFRPRPRIRPAPHYTYSSSEHFLTPSDFVTIYDVSPLYNAGYTGTGQTIAVVGQSEILASDVANFRTASGLPANAPTMTLVPNSGTATLESSSGDEDESDLDVQWSGGIAKNATVNFIYVGNNDNYSVFDALQYAIDNDVAPVISISYGACESSFSSSEITTFTNWFEQANAQGQTIDAASGDNGAADCDEATGNTVVSVATHGLAVDVPASTPYVTGVGGTQFSGDVSDPSTYWNSSNNADGGSAISYIPEMAWNDTSTTNGLSASGGGKSILFAKPSWQTGTGVPADGARDVPDIALNASPDHDGYFYCSGGSCTSGFAGAIKQNTIAGGTSFGAPTFSGILTLINQKVGSSGQGNINPTLYALAASTPSVYHDITTGNNEVPCQAGSTDCGSSGEIGYVAGTGYDQVTGWGTVDANALASGFAASTTTTPTTVATTTDLTASPSSPTVGTSVTFTATVSPNSGASAPTGTIQFAVDGTDAGSAVTIAAGSSGTSSALATYATSSLTAGSHTITAVYSGDSTHAGSTGTLTITVAAAASSSTAAFKLSATNVTVVPGASGTTTVTVTPSGGFTGTVALALSGPSTLTDACFTTGSAAIAAGAANATATITINTTEAACATPGARHFTVADNAAQRPARHGNVGGGGFHLQDALALVLLPFATLGRFRRRNWIVSLCAAALLSTGLMVMNGCGGNSTSTATPEAAAGTYTITVTGTDSSANLSTTTTLTLTIS